MLFATIAGLNEESRLAESEATDKQIVEKKTVSVVLQSKDQVIARQRTAERSIAGAACADQTDGKAGFNRNRIAASC